MEFDLDITKLGWFDKTIDNCTVATIPAGSTPKFIRVVLPGVDGAVIAAWWTGIPDLAVDDLVSVRFSPGNQAQYSIAGGGSGTAPSTAAGVSVDTAAFDNNLSAADDTVQKALETLDELTSGSWPYNKLITVSTTNPAADYSTLAAAVAGASAGDVILLDGETFTEQVTINKSLTVVSLRLGGTTLTSSSSPTLSITSGTVYLYGVNVGNSNSGATSYAVEITDPSAATFRDCNLSTNGAATTTAGVHVNTGASPAVSFFNSLVGNSSDTYGIYAEVGDATIIEGGSVTGTTNSINGNGNLKLRGLPTLSGSISWTGSKSGAYLDNSGNIVSLGTFTMADDKWIGLGASAGRIEFDDQATDEVNILAANVGINTSTPGKRLDVLGDIRTDSQLISTVATGTAPLVVSSTTKVANLNVDKLDDLDSSDFATSGHTHSSTLASDTHAATSKATPVDNDEIPLADSAATYGLKKLLWSALKTTLGFVSNKLGLAYGGSGADLSATGGSGQYVKQASAGGALTVGAQALNDAKVSKLRESDDGGDALTADASGNLTASANLVVDTGYTQVRQLVSKRNLSIADDTAVSHQAMAAGNRFMFGIVTNDGEWFFGVCTYNGITSIAKSTNFNIVAGGGTLAGTTGTDGRWNIRDNNGVLYVENRRGSSLNAGVTFFGSD